MILRPATLTDRAAVVALACAFHGSSPYARLLTVDPERLGAQFDVALQIGTVIVADAADVPKGTPSLVGFLALAALDHGLSGDRYAEEMGWWVEPAYRAGQLGPQLFRHAEHWARLNGCQFLKVSAPVMQRVARLRREDPIGHFYEIQGYAPVETAYFKRLTPQTAVA